MKNFFSWHRNAERGETHRDVAIDMNNMSTVLRDLKRYDEAREMAEKAVAMGEKLLGEDKLLFSRFVSNLGDALYHLEEYEQAKEMFEQCLAIDKQQFDTEY